MGDAERIDWTRGDDAHARGAVAFDRVLWEPGLLRAIVLDVVEGRPTGRAASASRGSTSCCSGRSADRQLRLRLYVFPAGYEGRAHHHRWSFVSLVLTGSYLHVLYGSADDVLAGVASAAEPVVTCRPQVVAGSDYFLDQAVVHMISADRTATSLMLRGPSVRATYFTVLGASSVDRGDGRGGLRVRWNKGADDEDAALRRAKEMTPDDFTRFAAVLEEHGVI